MAAAQTDVPGLAEWNMRGSSAGGAPGYKRSGKSSGKMDGVYQAGEAGRDVPQRDVPIRSDHSAPSKNERSAESAAAEARSAASSSGDRKPAFDRNGPVEAVALQSDWQFWNIFSDVRTIGKGHFAKVKQVMHNESREHFAAKILDKALADNDIEDLVRARARLPACPSAGTCPSAGACPSASACPAPASAQPPRTSACSSPHAHGCARAAVLLCQVREFQMLRALRHGNIIRLYAAYETPRKLYLVTELSTGGELMKRLGSDANVYSEDQVRKHVMTIVTAVLYMHSKHCVHRDLKPENVLLSDNTEEAEVRASGRRTAYRTRARASPKVAPTRKRLTRPLPIRRRPRRSRLSTWASRASSRSAS